MRSANLADQSLVTTLGVVHDALGPRSSATPNGTCDDPTPGACDDNRPPAVRASDTATDTMLYRNWVRGLLGSADSETAQKYGRALYDARSLSWAESERIRANPATRDGVLNGKKAQWEKVSEQIKTEDPEAYEYLQGVNGMDRIGSGFIAMLAAVMFAMFDLTASVLVLLGFLIFRWAVISAPILGTVGLLRPASSGIRRLGNAVVAAIFNIAIFGTGAAVYLFAVDLIMNTASLPGWLQVVLVWLCGVVGWLLLRPYRRITQLGGKDGTAAIASAGSWHRRFFRDMRRPPLSRWSRAGVRASRRSTATAGPSTPTRPTCARRPGWRTRRSPQRTARSSSRRPRPGNSKRRRSRAVRRGTSRPVAVSHARRPARPGRDVRQGRPGRSPTWPSSRRRMPFIGRRPGTPPARRASPGCAPKRGDRSCHGCWSRDSTASSAHAGASGW